MLRTRVRTVAALLLVPALVLGGCTGDDGVGSDDESRVGAGGGEDRLTTTARIGQVAGGSLADQPRQRLVEEVTAVVDDWIDAAYVVGDYPRSDFDAAFRAFTDGAARLAADRPEVMSNQAVGERVDTVTATRRTLFVDVLAPQGRPAGVTARVTVVVDLDGELDRTDKIWGRLMLTPDGKGGWTVFGFDVRRSEMRGR